MNKYFKSINIILLIGLALRLLNYYLASRNNPIFNLPIVDAKEYVDDASYYHDVSWLGRSGSYFHPPGYSYFIGILYLFFGKYLLVIRLAQMLLEVATIFLVFKVAEKTFDKRVALLSALMYAVYVRTIQYSIEILPPALVIFLLLLSVWFAINSLSLEERARARAVSFSGFFLGLLIITLPNFLLTIPLFIIWIYFQPSLKRRARMGLCALFIFFSLFPTSLTYLRNTLMGDEDLPISRNGGINFYIGNNPDINKTVGAAPGIEWEKLFMLPYENDRITNFQEQDKWFNKKAFEYVENNFGDWCKLVVKKTLWFFSAYEFPRNFDVYYFSQYSFITKYPVLNFAIVLPLALSFIVGSGWFMAHGWISKRQTGNDQQILLNQFLLVGITLIYSFSIILIFVAARYRLPIIPLILIFSGGFLIQLYDLYRQKKFKLFFIYLFVSGMIASITQQNFFSNQYPYKVSPVFTNTLLANTLISAGKTEEGKKYLDEAIALPVDNATDDACFELGHYYRGKNEMAKAREYFQKSIELDFNNFKSWNSMGFDYKMKGNFFEAIKCFQNGIKTAPCFPTLYLNLADCYLMRKNTDSAVVALESYYKNCPSPHPHISASLGKIYMDVYQNFERAATLYEESVLYPQGVDISPESYNRLGACQFKLKLYKQAKGAWMNGLEIHPGNKAIQTNIDYAEKEIPNWGSF